MTDTHSYKYDVAFSFLERDEALATRLCDLLEGQYSPFLYTKRQKELAGTDGELSFGQVFGAEARCVVVLYREEWGSTNWTRVEETSIRNRGHEEGYDFCIFIPLDQPPVAPRWLPKTRLWVGLDRWGEKSAAAVIDQRLKELGATPAIENLESRIARHGRRIDFAARKESALAMDNGARAFHKLAAQTKAALEVAVVRANAAQSVAKITLGYYREGDVETAPYIIGLAHGFSLATYSRYSNSTEGAYIEAALWAGSPPRAGFRYFDEPEQREGRQFTLTYTEADEYAWLEGRGQKREFSATELAEELVDWYFDLGSKP